MPVSTVFQHVREDAVPNPCWQTFYWPNSFSLTLSSNLSFSLVHSLFPVSQNTCSRYYVIIITSTLQRCHSTENKSDEKKKHTVRSNTAQAITHTFSTFAKPNGNVTHFLFTLRLRALLPSLNEYFSLLKLLQWHGTQTK